MREARILMTPALARLWRAPLYRAGFEVAEGGGSPAGTLEAVAREEPDILIVNALDLGLDVAGTARAIRSLRLTRFPAVIALFPAEPPGAARRAREEGAVCLAGPEIAFGPLLNACEALTVENRLAPGFASDGRVEALLRSLGFRPDTAGCRYLARAVALCARDQRCFRRMTREIYPAVGARCGAGPAAVERLIRHAIESAWLRGDMDRQIALFGNTVDAARGKPTNCEFIARITEALRLEANE